MVIDAEVNKSTNQKAVRFSEQIMISNHFSKKEDLASIQEEDPIIVNEKKGHHSEILKIKDSSPVLLTNDKNLPPLKKYASSFLNSMSVEE